MNVGEFQKTSATSPESAYLLITTQSLIRKLVFEHCMKQVPEAGRAFDWNVFDLQDDEVAHVLSAARTLPWFSPRRWVYVRNAAAGEKALAQYLNQPSVRTVMLLEVEKAPAGWPKIPVVEVEEGTDLVRWLSRKASGEGYEVEPGTIESLVETAGEDLQSLVNELEKLLLRGYETKRITVEMVREMVADARQYEVFALGDSIASGQTERALEILNYLYESGMTTPLILSTLYANFRRLLVAVELMDRGKRFADLVRQLNLWSYKGRESTVRRYKQGQVRAILLRLHEADRISKSTGVDMRNYLECLIIDTSRRISV